MVGELPDTSATVASIRASAPPPAGDTPVAQKIRGRRQHYGWGTDRMLIVGILQALTGKPFPLPWDDDAGGPSGTTESTLSDFGL